MLGFDIKSIGAPGAIPNGARSTSIQLSSTGERYFAGLLTTAINLFSPDFSTSTKSVAEPVRPRGRRPRRHPRVHAELRELGPGRRRGRWWRPTRSRPARPTSPGRWRSSPGRGPG